MSSIQFVETDALAIAEEAIQRYEIFTGETLYPGDEKRVFLLTLIQILVAAKNDINDTGKQNLLRYARGEVLDALGELAGATRLEAVKAVTILRFTLSQAQGFNIMIPAGTRATPDGLLYFVTVKDQIITAGQTYMDLDAAAVDSGTKYNGFGAGQVKILVDPIPYVASVSNTTVTGGGTEAESDPDYLERIRLAPKSRSNAGPSGAYEYLARSADSGIEHVSVTSPSAGVVLLTVLMKEGELPTQAVLDKVLVACSDKTVRPLTDNVQAQAPIVDTYNIGLTYYISLERQSEEAAIRAAIESADGVVDQYASWQQSAAGRDINPDELRRLMLVTGASRITLTEPVFTAVADTHVAKVDIKTITYGGLI